VTPDERSLLQTFLYDLAQTPQISKDPEADAMIADAVRQNPNALYLLVQHAILSDQALHQAQAQIQQLQSQGAPATSFLSPAQPWSGPGGAPIASSPFSAGSGLGNFLRTAGTMAAGVAGGDFIAEGIENIFSPRW
jgi:hypothetical protein